MLPPGYIFRHVRQMNAKSGGGVALLFKSCLPVNIKDNHNGYQTFESLHAEVSCNSKSLRLVVINRTERDLRGHTITFSWFLQEFETLVSDFLLHPSEILLTGSFTIHFDTSDSYSTRFKELLSSYALIQHVNEPTHRSGHCHDFVNTRDIPVPSVSNIIVLAFLTIFLSFPIFTWKGYSYLELKLQLAVWNVLMLINFAVTLIWIFQMLIF